MRIGLRTHLTRLLALAALAVSAALLVQYVRPNPGWCGFDSGCEQVLQSPFGRVLGIPLPVLGVATFGAIFAAALFPASPAGRLLGPLAAAAGLGGLALLVVQAFVLRRVCPYCLAVDVSAVALAVLGARRRLLPAPGRGARAAWLTAAAVAVAAAVTLGAAGGRRAGPVRAPVPPQVAALWVPGKVNVVEVTDFACPHCRKMHAVLALFLDEEGDRVHFARVAIPMPGHAQARPAARAWRCAERQGRGDALAEALFAAADLTPAGCERLADALGLSRPAFAACAGDPAVDERLDADLAWVKAACPNGLPVIWVQDRMLFGEHPVDALREALRAAERRDESTPP
jgi:uncharacterized membrane protein/predicted DsbA family dithiol-disulfide isomerase